MGHNDGMEPSEREGHLQAIETDGYTIVEDVLPLAQVEKLRERVREVERETLRPLEPGEREANARAYVATAGFFSISNRGSCGIVTRSSWLRSIDNRP